MNIVDPVLFQCRYNPAAAAICTPGAGRNLISYGRLEQFINNIGRKAHSLGLAPGQIVAIFVSDKIFHAALILGLTRLGIVTLSGRGAKLPKELRVDAVISDQPYPFGDVGRVLHADPSWTEGDGSLSAGSHLSMGTGDEICRIVLTSGTTGEPKAMAFSHNMLVERISLDDVVKGNRFAHSSRLYCDLGVASSPGFRHMLYMLWKGGTIFFYGDSPEGTVQAFDLYKIQNMVASPDGLAGFVKFYEMNRAFQFSFDHIVCSGGMLSRALSDRVRAWMSPNLICAYGSTEVGTAASAPVHAIMDIPGAVGYAAPGVAVEIVDQSGGTLPAGGEGVVRIRGRYNVDGYIGDPAQSAKAFRDGWFYPGDIGRLTPDRMLIITGRESSVLNIGGDKVRPELVEEALASFSAIDQAAVLVQLDDLGAPELWAAIVVSGVAPDETALRNHCAHKLGPAYVPHRFVVVDALPRNDMGKVERHRLPELVKLKSRR